MIIIEPPKVRKVVPSLRDLNNIEDAVWYPIKKKGINMPSKNDVIEFLGCAMVMVFIIALCFL